MAKVSSGSGGQKTPAFTVTVAPGEPGATSCLLMFRGSGLARGAPVTVDYLSPSGSMINHAPTGLTVAANGTLNADRPDPNIGLVQTFKVATASGGTLSSQITTKC